MHDRLTLPLGIIRSGLPQSFRPEPSPCAARGSHPWPYRLPRLCIRAGPRRAVTLI